MADATAAAVRVRTDVIPKYTLSEPPWNIHTVLEEELNTRHSAMLIRAAIMADPGALARAMQGASEVISRRPFGALSDAYVNALAFDYSLTPLLLWVCLQRHHPNMSRVEAAGLVTDQNLFVLRPVLLELMGLSIEKKGDPA